MSIVVHTPCNNSSANRRTLLGRERSSPRVGPHRPCRSKFAADLRGPAAHTVESATPFPCIGRYRMRQVDLSSRALLFWKVPRKLALHEPNDHPLLRFFVARLAGHQPRRP